MKLEIDLSKIDGAELEDLAVWFGRCEKDFQEDHPELEILFQQFADILRSESMARDAGMASVGMRTFGLLKKGNFRPSVLLILARLAGRMANDYRARSVFGNSLLLALML